LAWLFAQIQALNPNLPRNPRPPKPDLKQGPPVPKVISAPIFPRTIVFDEDLLKQRIALTKDGKYTIKVNELIVEIWEILPNIKLRKFNCASGVGETEIRYVFAIDKKRFLTIDNQSNDNIAIWNIDNGQQLATLEGHGQLWKGRCGVLAAALSLSGRFLCTGGMENEFLRIWDLSSFKQVFALPSEETTGIIAIMEEDSVTNVAIPPNEKWIAVVKNEREINILDLKAKSVIWSNNQLSTSLPTPDAKVELLAFANPSQLLLVSYSTGDLQCWDCKKKTLKAHVRITPDRPIKWKALPENKIVCFTGETEKDLMHAFVLDAVTGQISNDQKFPVVDPSRLDISADAKYILTGNLSAGMFIKIFRNAK